MPSMPYQQGFRPMLPEPAVRSAFSVANYGQQPSLSVMSNSHGSGSSVPPTNQMFASNFHFGYYFTKILPFKALYINLKALNNHIIFRNISLYIITFYFFI